MIHTIEYLVTELNSEGEEIDYQTFWSSLAAREHRKKLTKRGLQSRVQRIRKNGQGVVVDKEDVTGL